MRYASLRGRADVYTDIGDHQKAVADYTKSIDAILANQENALLNIVSLSESYMSRAKLYQEANDLENALSDYKRVVETETGDIQLAKSSITRLEKEIAESGWAILKWLGIGG